MSDAKTKAGGLGWLFKRAEAANEVAGPELASANAPDVGKPDGEAGRGGWLSRLRTGLTKTSSRLSDGITGLFTKRQLDAATLDELEDLLIEADLGLETSAKVAEALRKGRYDKDVSPAEVREVLAREIETVLAPVATPLELVPDAHPHVVLFVGVNGSGKTTTVGKYAAKFRANGKKVLLVAGDTFRAAAIDQLKVWGERTGATVMSREVGADPAGLAYDALKAAKDGSYDALLIDTAGRLQNKSALMGELEKVLRVLRKVDAQAPHDTVLVLDATTGQNALGQVEAFRKRAGVTGLVMTKLDGTARGGVLVALAAKFALPVHAIGVGEGVDDLQPFDAREFAEALVAA